MKLFFPLLGIMLFALLFAQPLDAQEETLPDWDFSAIFYAPPPEPSPVEPDDTREFSPMAMVRPPGFTFDGTFELSMGFVPGWSEVPWVQAEGTLFNWGPVARMRLRFDLDAQISEIFRVRSSLFFIFPGYDIELREVFFDYTLFNRIFLRVGRFNHNWGISPNYAFTNLLVRVPGPEYTMEPFFIRADIPVGVGGFQFLALTRADLLGGEPLQRQDVGFGGKFNLALRWVDIDLGAFFQERMPLRSFLSIQTTIGRTEWYNEWLGAINVNDPSDIGAAVNLGFIRDFFRGRVTLNGELFFNTERGTYWFRPETNLTSADTLLFNDGLNIAVNAIYRFRGRSAPRLFLRTFYVPMQQSAQVVPGFRLTPWDHLEIYFAVPMALGCRSGYQNTLDPLQNRPFAIVMMFTIRGTVRIGQDH